MALKFIKPLAEFDTETLYEMSDVLDIFINYLDTDLKSLRDYQETFDKVFLEIYSRSTDYRREL